MATSKVLVCDLPVYPMAGNIYSHPRKSQKTQETERCTAIMSVKADFKRRYDKAPVFCWGESIASCDFGPGPDLRPLDL